MDQQRLRGVDRGLAREPRRGEEVAEQLEHVFAPVVERWDVDADGHEAGVEIRAEGALLDGLFHVLVGRRHDPHVDLAWARLPDAPHLAVRERAQELGLKRERHRADLVEEESAAPGRAEEAVAVVGRARERTAGVAEQLALDERLGQRRAVDRDEGAPPAALRMDLAGHQLLADSRLAEHEHRRAARGEREDLPAHTVDGDAASDEDRITLLRIRQRLAGLEGEVLEQEQVRTDADDVAVAEVRGARDPSAADEGAVAALVITNAEGGARSRLDGCVLP